MKFHGQAGRELRTWILFFFGILLALFFAWTKNPLNPWWTIVIGGWTCVAIIVSAVQTIVGGLDDAARRAVDRARKRAEDGDGEDQGKTLLSVELGPSIFGFNGNVRRNHLGRV